VLRHERNYEKVRREVEALENLTQLEGVEREPIPESVRLFMWQLSRTELGVTSQALTNWNSKRPLVSKVTGSTLASLPNESNGAYFKRSNLLSMTASLIAPASDASSTGEFA
jgi:hypothetical protein